MPFNRPPRFRISLPNTIVKIPPPPAIPSKPESTSWLNVVLQVGAVLLSVILLVALTGGGATAINYLVFLPVMLAYYAALFITPVQQNRVYQKKLNQARHKYRETLRGIEDELTRLKKQEQILRLETDPDPGECILRLQNQDKRIGERRPMDDDFLSLRVGVGCVPSTYRIEFTHKEESDEFSQEICFINDLLKDYQDIPDVPIHVRLPLVKGVGIVGKRAERLGTCRALLIHLLTHHIPGEVSIAIICGSEHWSDWEWFQTLPHAADWAKNLPSPISLKNQGIDIRWLKALEMELQRREQEIISSRRTVVNSPEESGRNRFPALVIVLDDIPSPYSHPALNFLFKKGDQVGVYYIFLTKESRDVPGECGSLLTIQGGRFEMIEKNEKVVRREGIVDTVGNAQIQMTCKYLLEIDYPEEEEQTKLPDTIKFLEMFGVKKVEDLPVEKWWEEDSPYGFLRTPIGKINKNTDFIFDLNDRDGAHGPHGLIGGMTGSGKSEVLKAIILALAVTHHPYDLNFALIDFKGGAAFNELAHLPHTVGVVTDIESNATFAERVILALNGEIERRKRLLETARAIFRFGRSHIDEYRKLPVRQPLPRLVIVFDEFAEFKQRNPTESKKLISIARQGRSLGVHLILATQNIEAAVDPEILQNSSFRICLRVAEEQDSIQMVGVPDAVNLSRGRGIFLSNTRVTFQSAYSGAAYSPEEKKEILSTLIRVWPDGKKEKIYMPLVGEITERVTNSSTEAGAVVEHLSSVAQKLGLKKPPAVWPDALPSRIYLPELLSHTISGGWDGKAWYPCHRWGSEQDSAQFISPIIGCVDLPAQQRQQPVEIDYSQGGHLLIFGSAGSGKSTALRTLITSLALTRTPAQTHIYVLDFGGQSALKPLENFPHVGAVVTRLEVERTERLIRFIQTEIVRRNEMLRRAEVDNWRDYNAIVGEEKQLPELYLVIDNFRDFKQSLEHELVQETISLVSGGQSAGLFLIISASLQNDVPNDLFANINQKITFNQSDPSEYFRIVGQPSEAYLQEELVKGNRPGRGLLRGNPPPEFQAALPTDGKNEREQLQALIELSSKMKSAWNGRLPNPIQSLPLIVTLPKQGSESDVDNFYYTMLGLDFETLEPIGFSLLSDGPTFLVTSAIGQCGKTSLLQTWMLALAEKYTTEQLQVTIVDYHTRTLSALHRLPIVQHYVGSRNQLDNVMELIRCEIQNRQRIIEETYQTDPERFNLRVLQKQWSQLVLVMDDYERFYLQNGAEVPQLTEMLLQGEEVGFCAIVAGRAGDLPTSYSDRFIERFRKGGCGVLLGGIEGIDEFHNTRRPVGAMTMGFPPGRGYYIRRGKAALFQAAVYWREGHSPVSEWQQRIAPLLKKDQTI